MKSEDVITISSDDDDDKKTFGDQLSVPLSCCFCDRELGQERTPIILERCRHRFCKQCLVDVIQRNPNRKVKCPLSYLKGRGCDAFLQDIEVKAIMDENYYRFNYLNRPLFQRGAAEAMQNLHRQKFEEFQGRPKRFFNFTTGPRHQGQGRGTMDQAKFLQRYFANIAKASEPYPNVLSIGRGITCNEKENEPVPMFSGNRANYLKNPKAEEETESNFWKGLGSQPKKQQSASKLPTLKEEDNEVPLLVPNPFAQLVPNPLYNGSNDENTNDKFLD